MKKILSIIVKGLIFSCIPALLTSLSTTNTLDALQKAGYIGNAVNISKCKDVCTIISILLTFVLLTANLIIHEINEEKYRNQAQQLLKFNKDILVKTLSEHLGREYCDINIRIFVPYKNLYWRIAHYFNKNIPLMFSIKNIDGLANAGLTSSLKFQVSPSESKQGLVGACYQERKIIYDDNLQETNNTDYNLSDFQKSKTSDLKFIIVCPVFNQNKNIDAIIAFDSKHEIKINKNEDKFVNT